MTVLDLEAGDFSVDDEKLDVPLDWLVDETVPASGTGFIAAPSGEGKTFLVVDLMLSLARGKPFFGRNIASAGGSFLVAGEGGYSVKQRVDAARKHKFGKDAAPIYFTKDAPNILNAKTLESFIAKLRRYDALMRQKHSVPLRLVVFDTLLACFPIKDENSSGEVGQVMRAVAKIARELGVVVLVVHHYGKDGRAGMRGSSALGAAGDFVLVVKRKGKLTIDKVRDAQGGPLGSFALRQVVIGTKADGSPRKCAYVETVGGDAAEEFEDAEDATSAAILGGCIAAALRQDGEKRLNPDTGELLTAVRVRSVRDRFLKQWKGSDEAKRKALYRARQGVEGASFFKIEREEWVFLEVGDIGGDMSPDGTSVGQ